MGNGRDQQFRSFANRSPGEHHDDRAIFQPFFLPGRRFVRPQIGIGDDVSGLG